MPRLRWSVCNRSAWQEAYAETASRPAVCGPAGCLPTAIRDSAPRYERPRDRAPGAETRTPAKDGESSRRSPTSIHHLARVAATAVREWPSGSGLGTSRPDPTGLSRRPVRLAEADCWSTAGACRPDRQARDIRLVGRGREWTFDRPQSSPIPPVPCPRPALTARFRCQPVRCRAGNRANSEISLAAADQRTTRSPSIRVLFERARSSQGQARDPIIGSRAHFTRRPPPPPIPGPRPHCAR
jgi:hypothetical protein